jgi:hypothetical protein
MCDDVDNMMVHVGHVLSSCSSWTQLTVKAGMESSPWAPLLPRQTHQTKRQSLAETARTTSLPGKCQP